MKKGYTLLEVLISLCLSGLIITAMIPLYLRYNSNYIADKKRSENEFYAQEALMFIENSIKQCKFVRITGNLIELNYNENNIKKYIGLNSVGDIVFTHVENEVSRTPNNILNNITAFNVLQKENTVYVAITVDSGERYERCIGIRLEN
jgi:type II secretory pathway pseudopilin PulG